MQEARFKNMPLIAHHPKPWCKVKYQTCIIVESDAMYLLLQWSPNLCILFPIHICIALKKNLVSWRLDFLYCCFYCFSLQIMLHPFIAGVSLHLHLYHILFNHNHMTRPSYIIYLVADNVTSFYSWGITPPAPVPYIIQS